METGIKDIILSQNNRYTSTRGIYGRLMGAHRRKMDGVGLYTIADYCSTVMRDYLGSYYTKVQVNGFQLGFPKKNADGTVDLMISNGIVPVPLGVHRLLHIYNENNVVIKEFVYDGSRIIFDSRYTPTKVYADFLALPFEDDGNGGILPMVIAGGEMACYYFCLKMLYEEDFVLGKIPGSTFQYFNSMFDEEVVNFSPMRHISEQELDNVDEIRNSYYGHPFEYSFTNSYGDNI